MSSEKRLRKPRHRTDDERQRQEDELQVFWDRHGDNPKGVAVDDDGNIYVTVTGAILKLSPTGEVLAEWGSAGDKLGRFKEVHFIALDAAGNLFVPEPEKQRLQKLSPDGKRSNWQTGRVVAGGRRSRPVRVSTCRTLATACIVPESSECRPLNQWYTDSDSPGYAASPLDGDGNLWAVISLDDCIRKYFVHRRTAGELGLFSVVVLAKIRSDDNLWVVVDSDCIQKFCQRTLHWHGNVYVAEGEDNNRIQKFSPAGEPLVQWGATEWGKAVRRAIKQSGQPRRMPKAGSTSPMKFPAAW